MTLTSPPFVALFAFSWIFVLCQDTQEVKVKAGEDATLQCQGHRGAAIEVIRWTRPDLKSGDYVFFFRDGRSYKDYQHPSYHGRVELRDPERKDGDASVILKNININDTGTYECRIRKRNEKGVELIKLTVTKSGHTAGHKEGNVGLRVVLPVIGVLLLLLLGVGGFVIFRKYRRRTENEQPATNKAELQYLQCD